MKKRGRFTLVEFLALITVIGIFVVIGIVIVNSVIMASRLHKYRDSEDRLIEAVGYYITGEKVDTPSEIGNFIEITYNDMVTKGYINKIYDSISKEECINSRVVLKRVGEYDYEYIPKLVCTNYISVDGWNVLNESGSFEQDMNEDGYTDILEKNSNLVSGRLIGVEQYVQNTPNKESALYGKTDYIDGHSYYQRVKVKTDSDLLYFQVGSGDFVLAENNGRFNYLSSIGIVNQGEKASLFFSSDEIEEKYAKIRKWILLDLTDIYGTGLEISQDEMDMIIKNSGY